MLRNGEIAVLTLSVRYQMERDIGSFADLRDIGKLGQCDGFLLCP